ncbi:hypothetical protein HJFPF1_08389 [Paramyrothecium foliicola]|nr:hypothetical protein HJFPF1_08389 [Paramyrothecium foliicola]
MPNEVYSGITKELHAFKISILTLPSQFKRLLDEYYHTDAELDPVLISENQLSSRYDQILSNTAPPTQTETQIKTQTLLASPKDESNRYHQNEAMKALEMTKPALSQGPSVRNQFQSKHVTYNGPMQKAFDSLSKSVENSGNLLRRSQKALNIRRLASGAGIRLDDDDDGRGGNGKIRPSAGPAPLPASVSASGIETALTRILTAIEQGSYELLRSGECSNELIDIQSALDELLDIVSSISFIMVFPTI